MKQLPRVVPLLALMLTAAACAPAATPGPAASPQAAAQNPAPIQRTLVMLARGEPPSIAAKPLQVFSGSLLGPIRVFDVMLDSAQTGGSEEAEP